MITIFFSISILVYIILSWMIVYHLQTYTIDRYLARRAIIVFSVVTVLLVVVQAVLFLRVEGVVRNTMTDTQTDAFSTF